MPYAVEMDLDLTAAARVESIVCNIEAECGSDTVTIRSLGATAHVSLAVYDYIAVEAFFPRLKSFAARTACEHILLSSIGIFSVAPASIVFLAPAVTSGLLALHSAYITLALGGLMRPAGIIIGATIGCRMSPSRWTFRWRAYHLPSRLLRANGPRYELG